jgi:hypothetical protein
MSGRGVALRECWVVGWPTHPNNRARAWPSGPAGLNWSFHAALRGGGRGEGGEEEEKSLHRHWRQPVWCHSNRWRAAHQPGQWRSV